MMFLSLLSPSPPRSLKINTSYLKINNKTGVRIAGSLSREMEGLRQGCWAKPRLAPPPHPHEGDSAPAQVHPLTLST